MNETLKNYDFWKDLRSVITPGQATSEEMLTLAIFKGRVEELNNGLADAILLRAAGWTVTPDSFNREIFSWKWRRPGKRGGCLFESTSQAVSQLRRDKAHQLVP